MEQVMYSVRFSVDYPERPLDRLTTLLRIFVAIPHYIVLVFLDIAALVVVIVAWFAILFTGRYPQGDVRLRGGRDPLAQPRHRLRSGAGHRPLPTVPARPVSRDADSVQDWPARARQRLVASGRVERLIPLVPTAWV
jgi:hypothetical protein